jgi:H+-transporting ATPase
MTGHAVLTPLLMVVLMIIGDFLAMSLTTDNVTPSPVPNVWRIGNLTLAGVAIALLLLGFYSAVLAFGFFRLRLPVDALQTFAFVTIAFGGQATIYAIRERRHRWFLRPSRLLVVSSVCDVLASAVLAGFGLLMAPLAWAAIGGVFCSAAMFGIMLDFIKVPLFRRLKLT